MIYKEIQHTGIKIPPIIFGTSALGNLYQELKDETKLEIIKTCFDKMDTPVIFDCAGKYGAGLALESLGGILNKLDIHRDNVFISNKLGWLRSPLTSAEPTFEKGVWVNIKNDAVQEISYNGIIKCWEQGNNLLGEKYHPQLVSVHDPDEYLMAAKNEADRKNRFQQIIEAYRALSELKQQGKTKAIGVGAKNRHIIKEIAEVVDLDWVMFANSLTIYRHPKELVKFMTNLDKKGVTIINSAVFNAGFLIGGNFFDYQLAERSNPEFAEIFKWRDSFFEVCKQFSVSPSHACIQFGLSHPAVSSIALNTSKPANVIKNIKEVQEPISPEFYNVLKERQLIDSEYAYI